MAPSAPFFASQGMHGTLRPMTCQPVPASPWPHHISTKSLGSGKQSFTSRGLSKCKIKSAASQASTSSGGESWSHRLPNGLLLEIRHWGDSSSGSARSQHPPLLFIHGARHGAWCWEEHFQPYFAARGYCSYSVSLRGHGQSEDDPGGPPTMDDHIADVAHIISSLPSPPVLVAHSLSGVILQRYLVDMASDQSLPPVAGVAMMAAAAVTACMGPTLQWFQEVPSLLHAFKVIRFMLTKGVSHPGPTRELLFSADLPNECFQRYHSRLAAAVERPPMLQAADLGRFGKAVALQRKAAEQSAQVQPPFRPSVPVLVVVAGNDSLIMRYQVVETARLFGAGMVEVPGVAHDLMLDTKWERVAECLLKWLEEVPLAQDNSRSAQVQEGSLQKSIVD